jgi:polar amino acid transport system permease protein
VHAVPTSRAERLAARRARGRRHVAISAVSTVVVLGGLAAALLTSPGWHTVRTTYFSAHFIDRVFPSLLSGFWVDVKLFLIVEVIVLALGLLIALVRTMGAPVLFPLRLVFAVYVDVLRGVPLLILLYLIGFGIPTLGFSFLPSDETVLGGAALALCYSAYVSEVFRAGIAAVNPSQPAAGLALGLTRAQTLRLVVLPQAVRSVTPPLLNDFIGLTKDVALVSVLGPQEMVRIAQINTDLAFNFSPYIAAALIYLVITLPLIRVVDMQRRRALQRQGALVAL